MVELVSMTSWQTWRVGTAIAAGVLLGWTEWTTWRASRAFLPSTASDPSAVVDGECVLVLGNPSPRVQRWRVRIAVRSTDPRRATFVLSGGAVRTAISEAEMMADYAVRAAGVPPANIIIENQSRTTIENIANSLELMTGSPAIKIASDTLHARRARKILHNQSPDLAKRLVRTRDYIPFEYGVLHAVLLAFEHYRRRRARSLRS